MLWLAAREGTNCNGRLIVGGGAMIEDSAAGNPRATPDQEPASLCMQDFWTDQIDDEGKNNTSWPPFIPCCGGLERSWSTR